MSRVLTIPELALACRDWRREGAYIVLAAGCFDPLHYGHVTYLQAARRKGNVLVVSVAADHRVNKGPNRPRSPAEHRAGVVAALGFVDAAVISDTEHVGPVIEVVRPHYFAKGEEYRNRRTPALDAEAVALDSVGGRLEFVSGSVVCSSTAILAGV